ncbi:MAG: response regulator [Desulfococcaceae bacterium]
MQNGTGVRKGKILVVDDQQGWQELLEDILTQKGYKVKKADNLKNARDLLKTEKFDIAVLDMRLVDASSYNIDGMRVLKEAKKLQPTIKAIILTGYSDKEQKDRARDFYGADGYYEKAPDGNPFDIDKFIQIISDLPKS